MYHVCDLNCPGYRIISPIDLWKTNKNLAHLTSRTKVGNSFITIIPQFLYISLRILPLVAATLGTFSSLVRKRRNYVSIPCHLLCSEELPASLQLGTRRLLTGMTVLFLIPEIIPGTVALVAHMCL